MTDLWAASPRLHQGKRRVVDGLTKLGNDPFHSLHYSVAIARISINAKETVGPVDR